AATALWNTTTGPDDEADSTSAGSSSSRSPRTIDGGDVRAISTAVARRARRSSCSGQIRYDSQRIASSSVTSRGLRSMPPRHATSGTDAGSGTGPRTDAVSSGPVPTGSESHAYEYRSGNRLRPALAPTSISATGPDETSANAGTSVASRPTSLVWVDRERLV